MTAPQYPYFWRRIGRHGLGQSCDPTSDLNCTVLNLPGYTNLPDYSSTSPTSPTSSSTGINWNPILQGAITGGVQIGKQFASYASPIYNPGTFYQQTPYGMTLMTAGATTPATAQLSSLTSSSMMPLLLLGGGVLLMMMMSKR